MNKIYHHFLYSILLLNLAFIGYFWWQTAASSWGTFGGIMISIGQILGLIAGFFALMQFMLMGRAIWLEKSFGLDKLARVHRLNGYLVFSAIIFHPIFIIIGYAANAKVSWIDQFVDFWSNYENIPFAVISAFLFITIVFFSIYIVRNRIKYETWFYIHLLTYIAIILALGHQLSLGTTLILFPIFYNYWIFLYIFVLGNLVIFHFLKPVYQYWRFRFRIEKIVQETANTTSVYISGKNLQRWKSLPGQFIIVTFLAKKFWWQSHPFSLSMVPTAEHLRLTIKSSGDFTAMIPELKPGTPVVLEGPFGTFTPVKNPPKKDPVKYLFIAGGVGITPIRAMIEKVAPGHDLILIYSNRDHDNVIFQKELNEFSTTYHFPIHYLFSDGVANHGENHSGRLDEAKLKELAPDIQSREIYLCGPPPMTNAIVKILKERFGIKAGQTHYEKFAL